MLINVTNPKKTKATPRLVKRSKAKLKEKGARLFCLGEPSWLVPLVPGCLDEGPLAVLMIMSKLEAKIVPDISKLRQCTQKAWPWICMTRVYCCYVTFVFGGWERRKEWVEGGGGRGRRLSCLEDLFWAFDLFFVLFCFVFLSQHLEPTEHESSRFHG